ncbi:MAG: GTP pyrophosphokinase family protein [Lachnospiraceae bacterium]|nr:GTP pyrophosphokinase family protein [Lachnospiraceae bacterium]
MEIQLWKQTLRPYELAVDELTLKFNHIIKEYAQEGVYSPIEQVSGRVKSVTSILEKAQKKSIPIDEIEEQIEDIAGIRIICKFDEDIYAVAEIIKQRSDMEIKSYKDYIANMKPSGYRSYHIIIYYDVETVHGKKRIQAEVQIRTLAMNFWATIEHSLQYKYRHNIPKHIKEKLNSSAEAVLLLDKEMSSVHREIMDAQNSFVIKDNIVSCILSNIQNLYKIANKKEVMKIQNEFYRIYQEDDLEQLESFNKQLDVIAEGYRAQGIS